MISKDSNKSGAGGDYDPLDPNVAFFKKRKYVFKEYSSASSMSEANYSEIEQEEINTARVGAMEDAE